MEASAAERTSLHCCEQLVEVELCEGLEEIEGIAFRDCTSLKRFKVPSTVKEIGGDAFSECNQLVEVELCKGLERIESYAFCNCTSLKRFKVPSTVKVIGEGLFQLLLKTIVPNKAIEQLF